jgi:tetratricopeptide (TPR) repeat protein
MMEKGSRLLGDIQARLARARNPVDQACLRAERAGVLARQGKLDRARAELVTLHALFDGRPNAIVSAWLHFAEGLVMFFSDLNVAARDKMQRALALASAVQAKPMQALSAAWLAELDCSQMNFRSMAHNLSLALSLAEPDHHSARSRACLVTAQTYHWAERIDLAKPWYEQARQHATAEGDETMLSALMHNRAWMNVANARRLAVVEQSNAAQVRQASTSADSVAHFDELVGTASLSSWVQMLRAQCFVLEARYQEALDLFDVHLENALSEGLRRLECTFLADIAWCRLRLNDLVGAKRDAADANQRISSETHIDDRAMTHSRLAHIFAALDVVELADSHARAASDDWRTHSQIQDEAIRSLSQAFATGTDIRK